MQSGVERLDHHKKNHHVSLGGALITQAKAAPPEGALVTIIFQTEQGPIQLKGRIMSKVIPTISEVIEEGGSALLS